jgi:hypothetical protein
MAKNRSPNYPNYDLEGALMLAGKVYGKDGRNKVSREALASHLGHESLSGPALGKIGALRAYGLLEGSGDDMRLSEAAVAALKAPAGSEPHKTALLSLAIKPQLFQMIKAEYPHELPSKENLVFWLAKQGFNDVGAGIAANSYLKTMALVESLDSSYSSSPEDSGDVPPPPPFTGAIKGQQVKIMDGERIVFTEEGSPNQYLKLVASGEVDDGLLEALEDFVKRQRKRLKAAPATEPNPAPGGFQTFVPVAPRTGRD